MILIAKTLWLRRWIVGLGLVIAGLLALQITFHVRLGFPPRLESRQYQVWEASSQVLVDSPVSVAGDMSQGLDAPVARASLYGDLMTTTALVNVIASSSGVPAGLISVSGPVDSTGEAAEHAATGVPPGSTAGYKLTLGTDDTLPIILVTAQGPTKTGVANLTTGVATGLSTYVGQLATEQAVPSSRRVVIRQMGVSAVVPKRLGRPPVEGLTIFIALGFCWSMLVLFGIRAREAWRSIPEEALLSAATEVTSNEVQQRRLIGERSSSTGGTPVAKPELDGTAGTDVDLGSDVDGTMRLRVARKQSRSL